MKKKAFTLVELLVVIACIALLVSVLLPSLKQAKAQGRLVICLSKLRQCALAASAYTASYDGYYPMAYRKEIAPDFSWIRTTAWDYVTTKEWIGTQPCRVNRALIRPTSPSR